jgi:butyryl-CoA dehydrogenase
MAVDVASIGVQVHGGMGFIEETCAAQYYRDARILPIYEGTTAIQANDFVGRKTTRDGGLVANAFVAQVRETARSLTATTSTTHGSDLKAIARRLEVGAQAFTEVVEFVVKNAKSDVKGVYAGSVPYLKLGGLLLGGWQMARAAEISVSKLEGADSLDESTAQFYRAKIATARFFADHLLGTAAGLRDAIVEGSSSIMALDIEQF